MSGNEKREEQVFNCISRYTLYDKIMCSSTSDTISPWLQQLLLIWPQPTEHF